MYDLVLTGGRVVDPAQGLDGTCDVTFAGGRLRRALHLTPLAPLDMAGGLVLGAAAGLVAVWIAGAVLLHVPGQSELRRAVQRSEVLARLNEVVPPGRLRVLSPRPEVGHCGVSTPLYPGWAFAAARGTDPALSRAVLLALLALPPDDGGQAWSVPADS